MKGKRDTGRRERALDTQAGRTPGGRVPGGRIGGGRIPGGWMPRRGLIGTPPPPAARPSVPERAGTSQQSAGPAQLGRWGAVLRGQALTVNALQARHYTLGDGGAPEEGDEPHRFAGQAQPSDRVAPRESGRPDHLIGAPRRPTPRVGLNDRCVPHPRSPRRRRPRHHRPPHAAPSTAARAARVRRARRVWRERRRHRRRARSLPRTECRR